MRKLKHHLGRFLRNEDGLVMAEFLIMVPLLIWGLVAMFIYWDVFRTINMTQKAAYSIADLLSRQKNTIPLAYANGLQNIMNFLTPGGHPVKMRITSFECVSSTGPNQVCNATTGSYKLLFSYSPGSKIAALSQANIQDWKSTKIPTLNNGESVFVVETSVEFKAQLKTAIAGMMVGVKNNTFGEFIVTRPRHRRLCLEGTTTCN
ncbi:TadE/TadG family type IV pilus assembly protein [Tabrizicola sp.]|uniref:TadE/TadG family type IV pilus assembly protein n=1 Tax=Tabrizicola sp. TaxID=2005166 RepID=UPI002FDE1DB6